MARRFGGALSRIADKFGALSAKYDAVLVVGGDYTDVSTAIEWSMNAQIAAKIGSPVALVVLTRAGLGPIAAAAELARTELIAWHAQPVAAIANRANPVDLHLVRTLLARTGSRSGVPQRCLCWMRRRWRTCRRLAGRSSCGVILSCSSGNR
jgi:phosphate acetyltransferase